MTDPSIATVACSAPGSVWIEVLRVVPTALVAVFVAWVAYRQYRVAQDQHRVAQDQYQVVQAKLKLDLFDKRYAVFLDTWKILSEAVMKGTREKNWGLATPFNNFMPQASFLFGPEVADYLSTASKNWVDLHAFQVEGGPNLTPAQNERRAELEAWFHQQANAGAKELFGRYLNFERWK